MTEQRIRRHKVVSFTYSIRDSGGEELERSDLPISYLHGGDSGVFEQVEQALEGRRAGDTIEVTLSPEEGFGPHDPDLTFTDDIENVPPQFRHIGAQVEFKNEQGDARTFVVSRIADGKLTVDGNHPLAGKTLTFRVTVVSIRDATPEEMVNGVSPHGAGHALH